MNDNVVLNYAKRENFKKFIFSEQLSNMNMWKKIKTEIVNIQIEFQRFRY